MDEYIDKAKAIEEVNRALDRETVLFSFVRKIAISALKRLPAADVVVPVRCKECKHWSRENYGYCFVHANYGMAPDDFCSYGERREE